MRIDVVGKHIEITPTMRKYAEAKAEKLLRFFNGTQQITIVFEPIKHGGFDVEVRVDVVKHEDFVAHAQDPDLYAAVDTAVDKAQRQIRDFKEKLKNG